MDKNQIDVQIREYRPADKGNLLYLLRLNTPEYFATQEEADFIFYLDNEIEYYYVIEVEGTLVGCGGINLKEDQTVGYISWDIIHPQYHGKGLGTLLLEYRLKKLKEIFDLKKIIVRTTTRL